MILYVFLPNYEYVKVNLLFIDYNMCAIQILFLTILLGSFVS